MTDVQNYSECRVCGSSCGDLLCCETCPNVFHLKCTAPPLQALPRGRWTCPECQEVDKLQHVERIISSTKASSDMKHVDSFNVWFNVGCFVNALQLASCSTFIVKQLPDSCEYFHNSHQISRWVFGWFWCSSYTFLFCKHVLYRPTRRFTSYLQRRIRIVEQGRSIYDCK